MDTVKLKQLMKDKKAVLRPRVKTLRPLPGVNRYVLLPGWRPNEEHLWFREFGLHFIRNAVGEIQLVQLCSEAAYGRCCVVCEALERAIGRGGDDERMRLLGRAKAGQSFLVNVLVLNDVAAQTPQILELSRPVFGRLVELIEEEGEAVFDAARPQTIEIERTGSGLKTRYAVRSGEHCDMSARGAGGALHDLDDYVRQRDAQSPRLALAAIAAIAAERRRPTDKEEIRSPFSRQPLETTGEDRNLDDALNALLEELDDVPF